MLFDWLKNYRARRAERIIRAALMGHEAALTAMSLKNHGVQVILEAAGDPAALMPLCQKIEQNLVEDGGFRSAAVLLTAARDVASLPAGPKKRPADIPNLAEGVTHIIAVASGKGGVGKSTVATNLAVSLAKMGVKTGLLDADIYGPSIPLMMGLVHQKPAPAENGKLQPLIAHGVKCMSIGFLTDSDAPMIWRGPMVQSALIQLLRDVDWAGPDGLDILVIDLPPGTGDTQLTLVQKLKLAGAIVVSTPQDVALIDARKAIEMFEKTNVPILGIVENMSVFCCPNCGQAAPIFGAGGAQAEAQARGIPFLGALPLDISIRVQGDAGTPVAAGDGPPAIQALYANMARDVWEKITHPLDKKAAAC